MTFVDTGYWIALLDDRDELHPRALRWAAQATGPFLTTDLVLVETVNHLTQRLERQRLHRLLDAVYALPDLEICSACGPLIVEGLALHKSHGDKVWSLTDCTSFVLMRQHGITAALAYDHHFEQAGFKALLRGDPE